MTNFIQEITLNILSAKWLTFCPSLNVLTPKQLECVLSIVVTDALVLKHQTYPQCWLNIHCVGPVSNKYCIYSQEL